MIRVNKEYASHLFKKIIEFKMNSQTDDKANRVIHFIAIAATERK